MTQSGILKLVEIIFGTVIFEVFSEKHLLWRAESESHPPIMMSSRHRNAFRITDPLWTESTGGFLSQIKKKVMLSSDVFLL